MERLELTYLNCAVSIEVQDSMFMGLLAKAFGQVGDASFAGNPLRETLITVEGTGPCGYTVASNGILFSERADARAAAHAVMRAACDTIVTQAFGNTLLLHAAAVGCEHGSVALLGGSGTGKTSLAVSCSRHMPFMGDEFVFLDASAAKVHCIDFPFQVKGNNSDILALLGTSQALPIMGRPHGESFLFPRSILPSTTQPNELVPMKLVVFPTYDSAASRAEASEVDSAELVPLILGSIVSSLPRSKALSAFLSAVSKNDIKLKRMRYSDARQAADLLYQLVKEGASI